MDAQHNIPPFYDPNAPAPPPPPEAPPPQAPPRRGIIARALRVLLVVCLIGSILLNTVLVMTVGVLAVGVSGLPTLNEEFVSGSRGANVKVAIIPLEGAIYQGAGGAAAHTFDTFSRGLRMARNDKAVRAVVLLVDSPGGGVTASDVLYTELNNLRKSRTGIKIVASMGSTAASGGYYVSAGADHIVAHPTTITGSIGVIAMILNYSGLLNTYGVEDVSVTSGEKKDLMNPLRELDEDDRVIVQEIVDELFDRFVAAVRAGRGSRLKEAAFKKILDGRVVTAGQALDAGLIDEIGYFDDAVNKAVAMAGLKQPYAVVRYRRRPTFTESLFSSAGAGAGAGNSAGIVRNDTNTEPFHYLWPGPGARIRVPLEGGI